MSGKPDEVVLAFFEKMREPPYTSLRQVFEEYLADDCVWANSGFPKCDGKAACLGFLDTFAQATNLAALTIETLNLAVRGDNVITERIDRFHLEDGTEFARLDVGGILRVRGGQIREWRDYFDPRPLLPSP